MSYAGPASRAKRAPNPTASTPANRAAAGRNPRPRPPASLSAGTSDDHRPTLIFAAGILVGIAVGAGAALLMAPQTGSDTRRALARSSRQVARRGHDAWDDLRDEFRRARRKRREQRLMRREALEEDALAAEVI